MSALKKIVVATLISLLVLASFAERLMSTKNNSIDSSQPDTAVLASLLAVTQFHLVGTIYTYGCFVGTFSSNDLDCNDYYSTILMSTFDIELNLRCPESGSGSIISYVNITISVSSPDVSCSISEGAIGTGVLGITVNAANTSFLDYAVEFYS